MKYRPGAAKIPLPQRKALNERCLAALDNPRKFPMTVEDIFHQFTGVGGLHGLQYVDYGNYKDFSEAKKEIEQGQFFTSDALCKWVLDCIRPLPKEKVADLTCGKGSFFNHLPDETKAYGCEIDPDAYRIARHLFDKAHISLEDIRSYQPGVRFSLVLGNPPYNLNWKYGGHRMSSQAVYLQKAAELLYPGGLLAVIVPQAYLGENASKAELKRVNRLYDYVTQVALDGDAFAWLGVRNFPTKLLISQRRADSIKHVPFVRELVDEPDSEKVYENYVQSAWEKARKNAARIALQMNREDTQKEEKWRVIRQYLFQIKKHPATRGRYQEFYDQVEEYRTQKRPEGMKYDVWEEERLHSGPIIARMRKVLRAQNHVEEDRVALVKSGKRVYHKAYSRRMSDEAWKRNREIAMRGDINKLIPFGEEQDLKTLGPYEKVLRRKQREHRLQVTPFSAMGENAKIREWLENWELSGLTDTFDTVKIKLNPKQLYDTNLSLQKRYAYLQWSQGAGKTVSGTAQGMYRLAMGQTDYVFVVSSAISIETTWAPFFQMFKIPHTVVRCRADLRKIYAGDFVLITLDRVKNYKKNIKKTVKLCNRRIMLIYDEAQNSATLESSDKEARRTKAMLGCFLRIDYKLLMSGTSISNNVVEVYPQLYLLYNGSCNLLSMAETVYTYNEDTETYSDYNNEYYTEPYPPYMEGIRLFRRSHLPEKLTVFGVVKETPDIFNATVLRDIISYTMITRTFEEVTGKKLERRQELRAEMNPHEWKLYEVAQKEFSRLEYLYFHSSNLNERKKAQARAIAQIKTMLRICTSAVAFPEYKGPALTGKLEAIFKKMEKTPHKRVAIGVREYKAVAAYEQAARDYFPDRPVFTITGSELKPSQRQKLIHGEFEDYDNSILICTQQSLCESISIDCVDICFISELHWNDARMSQFYFRFIRYTSTRMKDIYYVNYADSIETNLIYLLVAKERMLRFLKGQEISFEDLFADMGFDLSEHSGVVLKKWTKDGPELVWGTSKIAA